MLTGLPLVDQARVRSHRGTHSACTVSMGAGARSWFLHRVVGAALVAGCSSVVLRSNEYASVTSAMSRSACIGINLTIGVSLLYLTIMDAAVDMLEADSITEGLALKPLSTLASYCGMVFTSDRQESLRHAVFVGITFFSMWSDLFFLQGAAPLVAALSCVVLLLLFFLTNFRNLKSTECLFGVFFAAGVWLSE